MQTLTFNTTKREVNLVTSQGDTIYIQKNVPTVKVMDQHYEVYVENFDGKKIPVFRAPIANTNINIPLKTIFSMLTSSGNSLSSKVANTIIPSTAEVAASIFKMNLLPTYGILSKVTMIITGINDFQKGLSNPELSKLTITHGNEK